ncbi:MAG: ywlF [Rickettsiales bacterium]|jgi:ribose 5-phosphate isomerase B|nr:ywlF [Rickettsiales bacterium]
MTTETIAIASDHAGVSLKTSLIAVLEAKGYKAIDLGTNNDASVDYPDFANALAASMKEGKATRGVLICGSGVGISIAANRHPFIRAALCHNAEIATLAREHNDANVLVLGARMVDDTTAKSALTAFLDTKFAGGRHEGRVKKLSEKI